MPEDFFPANYVNPDYATPEQLAQLRRYSQQLLQPPPAQHWAQGLSNIVSALVGGTTGSQANELQKQAILYQTLQNPIINMLMERGQLGGGTPTPAAEGAPVAPSLSGPETVAPRAEVQPSAKVWGDKEAEAAGIYEPKAATFDQWFSAAGAAPATPTIPMPPPRPAAAPAPTAAPMASPMAATPQMNPRQIAAFLANPWASDADKNVVRAMIAPQAIKDLYGQPGWQNYIGGIRPAQNVAGMPFGIQTKVNVGPAGVEAPAFITGQGGGPNMAVPGLGGGGNAIDVLAEKGRELQRLSGITGAGTKAVGDVIQQDIQFATEAPQILKTVGMIRDNIQQYGDKMTFGPTAPWAQEIKKIAANYAPGVMKDQLESIAAADSVEKLSGNLGSLLAKQMAAGSGGTDAQMFQGLKTVPGLMQSKQGALAMADMIWQNTQKWQELGRLMQNPENQRNWLQVRDQFFATHPIINPLTNRPVWTDIEEAKKHKPETTSGGWGIVR